MLSILVGIFLLATASGVRLTTRRCTRAFFSMEDSVRIRGGRSHGQLSDGSLMNGAFGEDGRAGELNATHEKADIHSLKEGLRNL